MRTPFRSSSSSMWERKRTCDNAQYSHKFRNWTEIFFIYLFAEFVQPYYENIADKLLLGTRFFVCGQFYNSFYYLFWVNIHLCDKDRQENSFPFFLLPCQVPLFIPFLMILPYIANISMRWKKEESLRWSPFKKINFLVKILEWCIELKCCLYGWLNCKHSWLSGWFVGS